MLTNFETVASGELLNRVFSDDYSGRIHGEDRHITSDEMADTICPDCGNAECECAYATPGLAPTWAEITTVFAVVVMLATLAVSGGR